MAGHKYRHHLENSVVPQDGSWGGTRPCRDAQPDGVPIEGRVGRLPLRKHPLHFKALSREATHDVARGGTEGLDISETPALSACDNFNPSATAPHASPQLDFRALLSPLYHQDQ